MTDSPANGLLSPSFASVLAFDEPDEPTYQNLQELGERDHRAYSMELRESTDTSSSNEIYRLRDAMNRPHYPRLELDAAMDDALDSYHALDGPSEQFNPQNTPASPSDSDEEGRQVHVENIRTISAPLAPPLDLNLLDDDGQQISLPGERSAKSRSPKRRLSTSDQLQSAMTTRPAKKVSAEDTTPAQETSRSMASARYVRFSPPPSPRGRSSRSAPYIIPSVERKQDYVSLYRQQKPQEKWKGANLVLRGRHSPRRSPTKSSLPAVTGQQESRSFESFTPKNTFSSNKNNIPRSQSVWPDSNPGADTQSLGMNATKDATTDERDGRVCDLVILNIGLYRSRYPHDLTHGSRWAFWRVQMSPAFIPACSLTRDAHESKQIVYRLPAEDLLLHFVVVLPYFIVQIPFLALAKAGRLANSRAGISFLDIVRVTWAIFVAFINFVLRKICGMELGYYGKVQTEYPDPASSRR